MAATATFPSAVNNGFASVTTGDTGLAAPSNSVLLITAAAAGTIVKRITGKARETTAAGRLRLWIVSGGVFKLREEIAITAITPSATVSSWTGEFTCASQAMPLQLKTGDTLRVSSEGNEDIDVHAEGADLT